MLSGAMFVEQVKHNVQPCVQVLQRSYEYMEEYAVSTLQTQIALCTNCEGSEEEDEYTVLR